MRALPLTFALALTFATLTFAFTLALTLTFALTFTLIKAKLASMQEKLDATQVQELLQE